MTDWKERAERAEAELARLRAQEPVAHMYPSDLERFQTNENAIMIADEAAKLSTSSASQPGVTASASVCVAQISSPRPGSSTDEPENGMNPSVSSATQIGCGWISVWSSCPRAAHKRPARLDVTACEAARVSRLAQARLTP